MKCSRFQVRSRFALPVNKPLSLTCFLRSQLVVYRKINSRSSNNYMLCALDHHNDPSQQRSPIMTGKRSHKAFSSAQYIPFDPERHLVQEPPKECYTMEDLGYRNDSGVSPIAVSSPFRLFTQEAIDLMREEVLSKEVQDKFSYTSDIAPRQIRGYAPS